MHHLRLTGTIRIAIVIGAIWLAIVAATLLWPEFLPPLRGALVLDIWTFDNPPKPEPQVLWHTLAYVAACPLALMTVFLVCMQWIQAGFVRADVGPFLKAHRLQDIIALIQILALREYSHRSNEGLNADALGGPKSSKSWIEIAEEHPEFFRLDPDAKNALSLVARHALPAHAKDTDRSTLAADLIRIAIELHDRQEQAAHRWQALIPLFGAALTAAVALVGLWVRKQ